MGNCSYCHAKAGFFKDAHESCAKDAEVATAALRALISEGIKTGTSPDELAPQVAILKQKGRLTDKDTKAVLLRAADAATLEIARAEPVSEPAANAIGAIFTFIDEDWFRDTAQLVNWHGYLSLLHSLNLHQVLHGQVPYYQADGFSDFQFAKGEHPILRRKTTLYEYRTASDGRNFQAVSVPIGGGVYYRLGSSQSRAEHSDLVPIDQGLMVIATQHIYFSSHNITFRLPYSSIIRLESFDDGFGIYENRGRGKVFIPGLLGTMDEGWYFYNLVAALRSW